MDFYLKYEPSFPRKESDEIRQLSDTLQKLPVIPFETRTSKFRNANGVSMKMMNLLAEDPRNKVQAGLRDTSKMDKEIWEIYEGRLDEVPIDAQELLMNLKLLQASSELDSVSAQEGGFRNKLHRVKERRSLRGPRLNLMFTNHGRYYCECCRIQSPDATEPTSILEVHHIIPLAEIDFIQQTTLEDLAVLCANCHRLIHARMRTHNQHVSPEDLQSIYYPEPCLKEKPMKASLDEEILRVWIKKHEQSTFKAGKKSYDKIVRKLDGGYLVSALKTIKKVAENRGWELP